MSFSLRDKFRSALATREVNYMCLNSNQRGQLYLGACEGNARLRLRLTQQRLESTDGRCLTNDLELAEPVLRPCVANPDEYSQMWGVSTTGPRDLRLAGR